jgi:hypothetical protein
MIRRLLFVAEKYTRKKEKWRKERGGKGQLPGHKLSITDDIIDKIIPLVTLSVILSVKILCHRMIFFFNSTVILLVYTDKFFLLIYLFMYFIFEFLN